MEKLKLEMDKMKEEEIIELPNNMELNISLMTLVKIKWKISNSEIKEI